MYDHAPILLNEDAQLAHTACARNTPTSTEVMAIVLCAPLALVAWQFETIQEAVRKLDAEGA